MKTTSLFVELLVIGFGCLSWVISMVSIFYGTEWINIENFSTIVALVPFVCITYVLGIMWDRSVDYLTDKFDEPLKIKYFNSSEDYHKAKDLVYHKSESVKDLFEYTRSRMRIVRAWSFNWLGLGVFTSISILTNFKHSFHNLSLALFLFLIFIVFSIVSFYCWKHLSETFYKRLKHSSKSLKNIPSLGQSSQS